MEALVAAELVVGACLALAICVLVGVFVRRRVLAAGGDLLLCALRRDSGAPWRAGLLRFDDTSLAWFPLLGVSMRPAYCWRRHGLEIGGFGAPPAGIALEASTVATTLAAAPGDHAPALTELALGREPYTALRAWVEATPPGQRPVTW